MKRYPVAQTGKCAVEIRVLTWDRVAVMALPMILQHLGAVLEMSTTKRPKTVVVAALPLKTSVVVNTQSVVRKNNAVEQAR